MSDTPRTDKLMRFCFRNDREFVRVEDAIKIESELNARIKRMEHALDLVAKMRADWLEMQDEGYSGAYYAFVKSLDYEWDEIMKAKESK